MLSLVGMFARASTKLFMTFVVAIILVLLAFAFYPQALNQLSDFTNFLEGHLRNPDLSEQGKFLFRTLVNENTIFGIVTTIIARSIVEFVSWIGGLIFKSAGKSEDARVAKGSHSY